MFNILGALFARRQRDIAEQLQQDIAKHLARQNQISNSPVAREAYTDKVIEGVRYETQDR